MEELSRSHIVSCGDELGGTFFKELFESIGVKTETGRVAEYR